MQTPSLEQQRNPSVCVFSVLLSPPWTLGFSFFLKAVVQFIKDGPSPTNRSDLFYLKEKNNFSFHINSLKTFLRLNYKKRLETYLQKWSTKYPKVILKVERNVLNIYWKSTVTHKVIWKTTNVKAVAYSDFVPMLHDPLFDLNSGHLYPRLAINVIVYIISNSIWTDELNFSIWINRYAKKSQVI